MQHLQIAYDLGVILIGLTALAMAGFWTVRSRETDLRNFWVSYALFTLVLVIAMLKKYLSVNVAEYSASAWYWLSGVDQVVNYAVLVAVIHFLQGVYQIVHRKIITSLFLLTMLVCVGLLFSPFGGRLDADQRMIYFGVGFRITAIWYITTFTFIILVGFIFLKRAWNTDRRNFMIGLLIFVAVGYGETLIKFPQNISITGITLARENDFLFSSIPYALYGFFLINYFLHFSLPASPEAGSLTEDFVSRYGITDREREIILKVMQGKSNADIAGELFISLATVKTHLHNIYTKIGIDSRYDLLARVRSGQ